jgi:hypothetical protein
VTHYSFPYDLPHPDGVDEAKADLSRYRVKSVQWQRELRKQISASRALLAESSEALAKAERVLERTRRV